MDCNQNQIWEEEKWKSAAVWQKPQKCLLLGHLAAVLHLITNEQFKAHSLPCPWALLTSHMAVERLLTGSMTSTGLAHICLRWAACWPVIERWSLFQSGSTCDVKKLEESRVLYGTGGKWVQEEAHKRRRWREGFGPQARRKQKESCCLFRSGRICVFTWGL